MSGSLGLFVAIHRNSISTKADSLHTLVKAPKAPSTCFHVSAMVAFIVTVGTMLSMYALLGAACPLAAFGGSMRPWYYMQS